MSYHYQSHRPYCFTEEGSERLIRLRDKLLLAVEVSGGVVTRGRALTLAGTGDTWSHMALIDRLVERGDFRNVPIEGSRVWQAGILELVK